MLSPDQIIAFHRQGYLGPLVAIDESAMPSLTAAIEEQALGRDGPAVGRRLTARHMDVAAVRQIASAPAIVAVLRSLLGEDVMLWNSYLWLKESGAPAIPWHQDIAYWPIEPWLTISVWVALETVDLGNACPRVIPGSHRRLCPHVTSHGTMFAQEADPRTVDESAAVAMVLPAGSCFVFNERILHSSPPNPGPRRRLGMSLRYATPFTWIDHDQAPLFPGHRAMLVAGADRAGINRWLDPAPV